MINFFRLHVLGFFILVLGQFSGCACRCDVQSELPAKTATVSSTESESSIAARVGGSVISERELEDAARMDLKKYDAEIYDIKSRHLDDLVDARLLELEAESRGISREALRQTIESGQETVFYGGLRSKHGVETHLRVPRAEIGISGSPMRGAKTAAVTIVEFSDFECPFCARIQPIMRQIRQEYPDQVQFSFRHFPLPFHRRAPRAHASAICAGEQGRFWEYRDMIFDRGVKIEPANLISYARELGLDLGQFEACVDDPRHMEKIRSDFQDGVEAGVQGTPAFFINGRLISGAQPFEVFARIIDEELKNSDRP